ncbi:MAG: DUF2339 domain-containing protein [Planctomycetes bacterium]|nr:DUF2339 domain-containing protein [Planctomycetota bacterium]
MSEPEDLKREVERLAERLAKVERMLRLYSLSQAQPSHPIGLPAEPVTPPVAHTWTSIAERLKETSPSPPPAPHAAPTPTPVIEPVVHAAPAVAARVPDTSDAIRTLPKLSPSDAVMERPARSSSLELMIGGKAMAWVGAIAVLLGAAFAIAVGVQRGWWGSLPPSARCIGIALAGVAMMVGGEIALRRIGRAASAGLFGAALGTLYLDAFATFRFFDLLEVQGAFVLMAVVAVIGLAITYRTRFLSIGVLSIVGGYLTPLLLRGQSGNDLVLLGYLTMLLGISLGLSALVPRSFRRLRYVALVAHTVLALMWLLGNSSQTVLAIVFMSMWWGMTLLESVYAALRRQSAQGNVATVLTITTLYVTGVCWLLRSATATGGQWLGAFTFAVGLLSAVIALQFGPRLDALRNRPITPMDKLAVALWLQFGVLLGTAVGLQFEGFGQSIGWLAIALAAVELGRRLPSKGVTSYGLVVGALALTRVWFLDLLPPIMRAEIWTMGDFHINRWSILALDALMVTHLAAQRIRFRIEPASPRGPVTLAALGNIQWLALMAACCTNLTLTGGWLFGVVFLMALESWGRRQKYFEIALLTLTLTAARWLIVDALGSRMNPSWSASDALPIVNWQMGMAVAIAATGWWAYRILRSPQRKSSTAGPLSMDPGRNLWQWILVVGVLFALVAMSFEIDRAVVRRVVGSPGTWGAVSHMRQLLLTLLWSFGALGLGLMIRSVRRTHSSAAGSAPAILMVFAWLMLCLCAIKWIFVDTLQFWLLGDSNAVIGSLPLANVQMLVGIALAVCAIVLVSLTRADAAGDAPLSADESFFQLPLQRTEVLVPIASCLVVLWGASFEVDRALCRVSEPWPHFLAAWPPVQLRGLLWTALWAVGGLTMMVVGKLRRMNGLLTSGWLLLLATGLAWLTFDTIVFRMEREIAPVRVVLNLQFAVGALVAALLVAAIGILRNEARPSGELRRGEIKRAIHVNLGIIALIGLVLGSFEINRWFTPDWSGVQTGLSVYWGLYGVALVLIGFTRRASTARYAGLGLLGITFFKALVFDMKNVDLVWRALIFVVVGLLFIGVSVVYAKVAPRMFGTRDEQDPSP